MNIFYNFLLLVHKELGEFIFKTRKKLVAAQVVFVITQINSLPGVQCTLVKILHLPILKCLDLNRGGVGKGGGGGGERKGRGEQQQQQTD